MYVSYSSPPKRKQIHTKDHIFSESAHHVVWHDCYKKCKKLFSKKIKVFRAESSKYEMNEDWVRIKIEHNQHQKGKHKSSKMALRSRAHLASLIINISKNVHTSSIYSNSLTYLIISIRIHLFIPQHTGHTYILTAYCQYASSIHWACCMLYRVCAP